MWNMQGQMVLNKLFTNEIGNAVVTREIDVSELTSGIYFIEIFEGDHIRTEKLILK